MAQRRKAPIIDRMDGVSLHQQTRSQPLTQEPRHAKDLHP